MANATRFVSSTAVIVILVTKCVNALPRIVQTISFVRTSVQSISFVRASGVIRGIAAVVCAIFRALAGRQSLELRIGKGPLTHGVIIA